MTAESPADVQEAGAGTVEDNANGEPLHSNTPQRRGARRVVSVVAPLLTFAMFVGIWYLFATVLLAPERRFLVPPPHDVLYAAFVDSHDRAELLMGFWQTAKVALAGLFFSMSLGIPLAVTMSQGRWVEASLYPYAVLIQVTPILAIVPLLGLMFGFNFTSRVIVSMIISLFPIVTNTLFGLKSAAPGMHDLFTLHKASRFIRFWRLQLPAARPALFTGLRIAAGASVIGAIVGDFFFRQGGAGLGVLLDRYRSQLRTDELYGAIIYSVILGLIIFFFFGWLAKRSTGKWAHQSSDL